MPVISLSTLVTNDNDDNSSHDDVAFSCGSPTTEGPKCDKGLSKSLPSASLPICIKLSPDPELDEATATSHNESEGHRDKKIVSEALDELRTGAWLSSDTINCLQREILATIRSNPSPHGRIWRDSTLLDPLALLSAQAASTGWRRFREEDASFVIGCVHDSSPGHWTLAIFDCSASTILWYDPLPSPLRTEEASTRLRLLAEKNLGRPDFSFSELPGPRQIDGSSCGIFVLQTIHDFLLHGCLPSALELDKSRLRLVRFLDPLDSTQAVSTKPIDHATVESTLPSGPDRTASRDGEPPEPTIPHTSAISSKQQWQDQHVVPRHAESSAETLELANDVSSPHDGNVALKRTSPLCSGQVFRHECLLDPPSQKRPRLTPVDAGADADIAPARPINEAEGPSTQLSRAYHELKRQRGLLASFQQPYRELVAEIPRIDVAAFHSALQAKQTELYRLEFGASRLKGQLTEMLAAEQELTRKREAVSHRQRIAQRLFGPDSDLVRLQLPQEMNLIRSFSITMKS